MGKIELIDTGRLTEKQARINMEKCAEFLARMIQKYGDVVLGEIAERNAQLQGKGASVPVVFWGCRSFCAMETA